MVSSKRLTAYRLANGMNEHGIPIGAIAGLQNAPARAVGSRIANLDAISDAKVSPQVSTPSVSSVARPPIATAAPVVARASAVDMAVAAGIATAAERARASAVYASEHSKGRERVCATLLGHPKAWSATYIIAQLPHLPTDRAVAVKNVDKAHAATDAVWARAWGVQTDSAEVDTAAGANPRATGTDGVWERAYARIRTQDANRTASKPTVGDSDAVWARAWGSAAK